jgi:peptidoglycan/LPS O-acetylase OafA/YrhL
LTASQENNSDNQAIPPSNTQTLKHLNTRIPALDGLRGLAILAVMLSHFTVSDLWDDRGWYKIVEGGVLGVDLFFVLSGFLITGLLLDSRGRADYWTRFYRRRILRIFPLYYFTVLLVWLVVVFVEKAPHRLQGYDSLWWFVPFASNVAMSLKNDWLFHSELVNLNHLWSLAVEEQFYLVWPFIVWLLPPRWIAFFCLTLIGLSTPLRYLTDAWVGQDWSLAAYVLPYCRLDGLAAGGFLAVGLRQGWLRQVPSHRWIARILGGWMGYLLIVVLIEGGRQSRTTLAVLFFASILYLTQNPEPRALVRRLFEHPFLRDLGKYSYALYIFHHLFEAVFRGWFGLPMSGPVLMEAPKQLLYIALAFACSYGLARLSWALIERPFLRMK